MDVDPKLVQSFVNLNIGEKLPIVTSSMQTEISIPPKVFLDQIMVDMMLNSARMVDMMLNSARDVPKKQVATCEASMQGLGKSSVSIVSSTP